MACDPIVNAINCIHSAKSTAEERSSAYTTCEQFKQTCHNLPLVGLELAKPTNPTTIRHFGYQLLEHFVKFKWSETSDSEKHEFRTIVTKNLLENGTLELTKESGLIRNILTALVTELLKRDWPQQWPDFLSIVERNVALNNTAGEVLLTALGRLVEDIELDSKLSPSRRSDLLRSVGLSRDQIIELVSRKLQEVLEGTTPADSTAALYMTSQSGLGLLGAASTMTWFQAPTFFDKSSPTCTLLLLLWRDGRLRQGAADVVYNLSARKTSPADNLEFSSFMLQDDALKMVFDIASDICAGELNDESVLFLKTLCRTYTQLGENHISGAVRNHLTVPVEAFQKYLQLMLIFYQHDLISVRSIVVDLWVHLLNFDQMKKNPDLLLVVPHVIRATQRHFCKPLEDATDVFDRFELLKIFNVLLSKMISVVGLAAKLRPNETLEVVAEWQGGILASPITTEQLCSETTRPFNVWKYFSVFTEKAIVAALKSDTQLSVEPVQAALRALLKFDSSDPLISYWHVSTINAYVPTFRLSDALTIPMLEKLFALLGRKFGTLSDVGPERMGVLVADLQRHTSSCLLRFVTNYPTAITWEVFQAMQQLYENLLTTVDNQRYGSMLLILEALIAGSNNIPDLEQQKQYIQQLIKPLLVFLDDPELPAHCKDFPSFLAFLEITPTTAASTACVKTRQLRLSLATLCAICKRFTKGAPAGTSTPTTPAFEMVYPYLERVFTINRLVNMFWCSTTTKDIPWLKGPLEPDKETKMIYCTLLDKRRPDSKTTFRMNMVALTDYANQFVESVCEHQSASVYHWEPLPTVIMDCYVRFLPTIQAPRIKAMLHSVIQPFIVNCPFTEFAKCLPVLQVTLETVYKRLSEDWEQIQARKLVLSSDDYSESSAELDEIFNDHMVLIVTREYCELLSHFLSRKSKSEKKRRSLNSVTEHLITNRDVSAPLLVSVFSCMSWGDGVSSNRACAMAHAALKLITAKGMPLSPAATHTFLVKALRALQVHGQHDNCLYTLLNVIIAIIQVTHRTIPHVARDILLQVPSVVPEKIDKFFCTLEKPTSSDRNMRDALQSLVSPIISRPISEAGKQQYKIQDLGPLLLRTGEEKKTTDLEGIYSLFGAT